MINEIRILIDQLNHYTDKYNKGQSEWSDKEWDDHYFRLQQLEKETGIIYPDSPTQTIWYLTLDKLNKSKHDHPMLSLDKSKDIDDIKDFIHEEPFVGMFKMDGLTCSLTYENGELIKAETRGDGLIGEDVTHNARVVKNIPQQISWTNKLVVDGEIICRYDDFQEFENEYKNPRNFAAGSIRLLSSTECAKRNLTFVAWDMVEGYSNIELFGARLTILNNLGFTVAPYVYGIGLTVEEAVAELQEDFDLEHAIYPIDGYVFKFDDTTYGKSLGRTDHHFKDAIALKLYDETHVSYLNDIEWSMGRTGVLTPIALFDPIDIDGTEVSRASLHNVSMMYAILGEYPYIGEEVHVFKANAIIPQIAEAPFKRSLDEPKNLPTAANYHPTECPICGEQIKYIISDDGVLNAYCSNPQCEGKLVNRLVHFFGKKGLDIKGISKATFEKLIDWGWVNNIIDVFELYKYKNEWIKKSGFGQTSVTKIINSIEAGKKTTFNSFISAIGIPLIGQTAAKDLANKFKTYGQLRKAVDELFDFTELPNFGFEMNNSILRFNYAEADEIAKILTFIESEELSQETHLKLEGMNIVITGKLSTFRNRTALKEEIEKHGGKVTGSITSKTSLLINNDVNSTSAKNRSAKEKGIPIISEAEFIERYLDN